MKVAAINFSGNVGKSTVAKHMLLPRIPGATLVAIETINADEGSEAAVRGSEFGKLQQALLMVDAAVVDIGASNVEDVMHLMRQYRGSHDDFDLFVVPTTREAKQTRDTVTTIEALANMGVPPEKIRVVFNRLEAGETVDEAFEALVSYHQTSARFTLSRDAFIIDSELFQRLRALDTTVEALLSDDTDWKAQLRAADTQEEKDRCAAMLSAKRLALSAKENLDRCFMAVAPAAA